MYYIYYSQYLQGFSATFSYYNRYYNRLHALLLIGSVFFDLGSLRMESGQNHRVKFSGLYLKRLTL
jgi:hypothetical protein